MLHRGLLSRKVVPETPELMAVAFATAVFVAWPGQVRAERHSHVTTVQRDGSSWNIEYSVSDDEAANWSAALHGDVGPYDNEGRPGGLVDVTEGVDITLFCNQSARPCGSERFRWAGEANLNKFVCACSGRIRSEVTPLWEERKFQERAQERQEKIRAERESLEAKAKAKRDAFIAEQEQREAEKEQRRIERAQREEDFRREQEEIKQKESERLDEERANSELDRERRAELRREEARQLDDMVKTAAEFITLSVLLSEKIRSDRVSRSHGHRRYDDDFAREVFMCAGTIRSPALAGWCQKGDFYGPVHAGALGMYARADGNFVGLAQVALGTSVGQSFYGLLQSGIVNDVNDDFYGIAQVGFINIAGNHYGLGQFGWINSAGEVGLFQVGGVNDSDLTVGFQLGAVLNRGIDVYGLAAGGFGNEHKHVFGMQVGGIFNITDDIRGMQFGLVNVSDETRGLQVGLVNITKRLRGCQIGGFNVSRDGGFIFMPGLNVGW